MKLTSTTTLALTLLVLLAAFFAYQWIGRVVVRSVEVTAGEMRK